MIDALNAEISLGTVANVDDAIKWLGYTYLYVRMRKDPYIYGAFFLSSCKQLITGQAGLAPDASRKDPNLRNKRSELTTYAARKLADARMIIHDAKRNTFIITDLGRIAAKYYVRHSSIEIFNSQFRQ